MKNIMIKAAAIAFSMIIFTNANAEKLIIGTFGDPTPYQAAIDQGKFSKATGWDIEWRKFESGADVISAMASGDVQISELGSAPLTIAVSQGLDIKMFLISFLIGSSESLIVRNGSGIAQPADLKGKTIGVPIGSTAQLSLTGALKHWGISEKDVHILGMPPQQINAAWTQKNIDAAFVWNPVQSEILKTGKRLVSAGEVAKWGFPTFNAWVANEKFLASHKKELAAFAKAMNAANQEYLDNKAKWTADSAPIKAIAKRVGASPSQVTESLSGFEFLTASEQTPWIRKNSADALKKTAEFLKANRRINAVLKDYSQFVDPSIAEAVQ
ncbi:ABC transporter substrate-binding protein [uncultured Castellaniella sp.]|uniref:taurine ABC transporter substrate-binding protein n=1 Tax=uncultured Castellaniella sp. TaxID=647907 RepID=UPI0026265ADA|nr:ABC transporter substrate-binding protein [uncultured Castellaniella sp.]